MVRLIAWWALLWVVFVWMVYRLIDWFIIVSFACSVGVLIDWLIVFEVRIYPSRVYFCEFCDSNFSFSQNLLKKYGNDRFKVGEDDDGNSVRMKLQHYLKYMKEQRDDSPMYIFDSSFVEVGTVFSFLNFFFHCLLNLYVINHARLTQNKSTRWMDCMRLNVGLIDWEAHTFFL